MALCWAHWDAVQDAPLVQYGYAGAEYLEHVGREKLAAEVAREGLVSFLVHLPRYAARYDAAYPPFLHLAGGLWGLALGREDFGFITLMNLPLLVLLALSTGHLARALAMRVGGEEARRGTGALAMVAVLLFPAIFATARRYYYDLPMTVWVAGAAALLAGGTRSTPRVLMAGAASGLALMTKWQAALFLGPVWGLAMAGAAFRPREGRGAGLRLLAGLGVAALLCQPAFVHSRHLTTGAALLVERLGWQDRWPVRIRGGASLDGFLDQSDAAVSGTASAKAVSLPVIRIRTEYYLTSLPASSMGGVLAGLLMLALALSPFRKRLGGGLLVVAGIPFALVAGRVTVVDERFLLPLLPWVAAVGAAGWSGLPATGMRQVLAVGILGAGIYNFAGVEGWLGPDRGPRDPVEQRGWNRRDQERPSPWRDFLLPTQTLCHSEVARREGFTLVGAQDLLDNHAWEWALARGCPMTSPQYTPSISATGVGDPTGLDEAVAKGNALLLTSPLPASWESDFSLLGKWTAGKEPPDRVWGYVRRDNPTHTPPIEPPKPEKLPVHTP